MLSRRSRVVHMLVLAAQGAMMAVLALLCSCSNLRGPKYEPVALPSNEEISTLTGKPLSPAVIVQPDWWAGFGDPYLNGLVEQAIAGNLDLKEFVEKIELQERKLAVSKAARVIPKFDAAYSPSFGPGNAPQDTTAGTTKGRARWAGYKSTTDPMQLSWEIDIWGKLKTGIEEQKADYRATTAEWRWKYLEQVSDVASTYFSIRRYDEEIALIEKSMAGLTNQIGICKRRVERGLMSREEANTQKLEGQLDEFRAEREEADRLRREDQDKLALLLGRQAGTIEVPKAPLRGTVTFLGVPNELPVDLVSRRPDVDKAMNELQAADCEVAVRSLSRLPTIQLSAQGLFNLATAPVFGGWLGKSPVTLSYDPAAGAGVIDAKRTMVEKRYAYLKAVQTAIQEVRKYLRNVDSYTKQLQDRGGEIRHYEADLMGLEERVKSGSASQLEVFVAEREVLAARRNLVEAYWQALDSTVNLYRALGGGWPATR